MDLSVNNINSLNNKKISFQGMKGALDKDNSLVFKFIAPPFNPNTEKVTLQLIPLKKDSKTDEYIKPNSDAAINYPFNGSEPLEILQKEANTLAKTGFAYRYMIESKDGSAEPRFSLDTFKKIPSNDNKEFWNIIEQGKNYGVTPKTGAMYHVFVDSNAILDTNGKLANAEQNKEFVRNHFNKLGGSIKGLTYLLKETDELSPYRYIISTPDIGADPTSSHKYWPNNQYQCANMEDFKEFNYELFKQGKGYIADGAFTSQSLQSPLLHHVLKWGENSPLYNMFKIDGKLNLGVLPDVSPDDIDNIDEHFGVKLVNSPKAKDYNANMPTYIQFFDDRLSSKAQQESSKLIDKYDMPNPEDHYDIVSHQDSIQPFYFEIEPTSEKISAFKGQNAILFKDMDSLGEFLEFPNFNIVRKAQASGATFWDGNVDIVKMNLSRANFADKKNYEGYLAAKEYLYNVATFWTEGVQSDLILKTAMADQNTLDEIIENNLTEKEYMEVLDSIEKRTFNSSVLMQDKNLSTYIQEFPFQSIETSPELSAIFTQSDFKKELYTDETLIKITALAEEIIDTSIPKKYRENEQYRTYADKTLANTVIKNIIVAAMKPEALKEDGTIDLDELKTITLKSFQKGKRPFSAEEERQQVVEVIKNNIPTLNADTFRFLQENLKASLKNVTLEDFIQAEAIVAKSRAGLNWRFDAAKDIGDLDAIRSGKANFNEVWDEVSDFWSTYIENVRKYNPSAYIISEITDLWGLRDINPDAFDAKMIEARKNDPKRYENIHAFEIPYAKEMQFLELSGSTTSSNYDAYFNKLSEFAGVNPENGTDATGRAGNVDELRNSINSFVNYVQPNIALLSHTFVDNHDKPRLLHCFPLDMALYMSDVNIQNKARGGDFVENSLKEKALAELGYKVKDPKKVASKAVAVAKMMQGHIKNIYGDSAKGKKLNAALLDLMQGNKYNEKGTLIGSNYRRSEAFGTLPYEVTIKDLFKKAGINDENEIKKFNLAVMEEPMKLQERAWQMINAIVGTPTLFNGTEFAQTGYETPNKNVYVGNRGRIMHELKDEKGFKEYFDKTQAISSLYLEPGLSAIRDGFPIVLQTQKATNKAIVEYPAGVNKGTLNYINGKVKEYSVNSGKSFDEVKAEFAKLLDDNVALDKFVQKLDIDNTNFEKSDIIKNNLDAMFEILKHPDDNIYMLPIYKYDENGSKTVSVITNNGLSRGKVITNDSTKIENCLVDNIPLIAEDGTCPFEEDTILIRKIYDAAKAKYVDDKKEYIVKNGKIEAKNGKKFKLDDTVITFYAKNDRNNKVLYSSYLY